MKMSLTEWRKVWWELIESRQGNPAYPSAKPTDSQKIGINTELKYGKNDARRNRSGRHGEAKVG
jgi:hypothetical protein